MEFSIEVDSKEFFRQFKGIKDEQLPFAFAQALTWTAKDVQTEVIKDLPQQFTLRTKWYMPQTPWGFKIEKATPTTLTSAIFTRAPWMTSFEQGEIRTPRGAMFTVPTTNVRRSKRDLIVPLQKPAYLLHKAPVGKKAFFALMKSGKYGIFQRLGKARLPIKLMYHLIPRAKIKERLKFRDTAQRIVEQKFSDNFIRSFEKALRTAR